MRHVVRKIEPNRATLFDDRLWPVLSAQLVLGGAVLGMIRLTLRPDDPRPWLNPQIWTLVAVVAIAVGMLGALCVKPHRMRRGAQLSLVLSLAINVTLLLVLSLLEIAHAAVRPPEVAEIQPASPVKPVEPEYFPLAAAGPDRPVEEWKKPVPTGDPQMQQQDWLNKSSQPWDAARPQVPEASAQASDPRSPLPRVQRQRMESAPREFDLQGALSRQDRADTPRVAPPLIDASAVAQQTQPARLAAPPAELQRQVTSVAERPIDLESSPASQTPRLAEARPQHQQAVAPEPAFDAQSALRRQMPTPGTPPQAEVAIADRPAAARLTDPVAAVAAGRLAAGGSLAAPLPATLEASPGLDTTLRVPDAPPRVRRQPAAIAAQMAESNEPLLARRETTEATPATVTRLAPLPAAVRSVAATDATAAAASVAMQRAEPVAPTPPLPSPSVTASLQPVELRRPTAGAAPARRRRANRRPRRCPIRCRAPRVSRPRRPPPRWLESAPIPVRPPERTLRSAPPTDPPRTNSVRQVLRRQRRKRSGHRQPNCWRRQRGRTPRGRMCRGRAPCRGRASHNSSDRGRWRRRPRPCHSPVAVPWDACNRRRPPSGCPRPPSPRRWRCPARKLPAASWRRRPGPTRELAGRSSERAFPDCSRAKTSAPRPTSCWPMATVPRGRRPPPDRLVPE